MSSAFSYVYVTSIKIANLIFGFCHFVKVFCFKRIKTKNLIVYEFSYIGHSILIQSYRLSSSPRGFGLVISNVTFDPCAAPDLDPRKGGEVDDEVLRKVFTELDYVVAVHRDLTAQVKWWILQDVWNVTLLSYLLINLKKGRLGQTKEDVR